MKNIMFVVWMIGYPLMHTITDYIYFKMEGKKEYSPEVNFLTACTVLFTWYYIGYKLYE